MKTFDYYVVKRTVSTNKRFDPVLYDYFYHIENAIAFIEELIANNRERTETEINEINDTVLAEYKKGDFRHKCYNNWWGQPIELYRDWICFNDNP